MSDKALDQRVSASGATNTPSDQTTNASWSASTPPNRSLNASWITSSTSDQTTNASWTASTPPDYSVNASWAWISSAASDQTVNASLTTSTTDQTLNTSWTTSTPKEQTVNASWATSTPKDQTVNASWTSNTPKNQTVNASWTTTTPKAETVNASWATSTPKDQTVNASWTTTTPKDQSVNASWAASVPPGVVGGNDTPRSPTVVRRLQPSSPQSVQNLVTFPESQTKSPRAPPPSQQRRSPSKMKRQWVILIPLVTLAFVVVFLVTVYVDDCPRYKRSRPCFLSFLGRFSFQPLRTNPLVGPSSTTLQKLGAIDTTEEGRRRMRKEGWRLMTCTWLHGGVLHLGSNLLGLLAVGWRLEKENGIVRVGILYLVSGFGGALSSSLFLSEQISVGASGAVFGLLGGTISELLMNWSLYENKYASLFLLLVLLVVNLLAGLMPNVDNFAHLGGLLTGFLLGFVLLMKPQFKWQSERYIPMSTSSPTRQEREGSKKYSTPQLYLWWTSLCLVVFLLVVAFILLFSGYQFGQSCPWCRYLSCVPTKFWKCNNTGRSKEITCQLETVPGESTIMICPNGRNNTIANYETMTKDVLSTLCGELCS